ncbi:MAG: SRPBCC family protein [Actinomycetota bacterium]|nr:SRPBCC family protein [Actinomycetota bacterium]
MNRLWATKDIAASAETVWSLLVNTDRWPDWGPTVRNAELDAARLCLGGRGRVQTAVGLWLPFEITRFDEGRAWSWKVGGVAATDHEVAPVDDQRCRLGFGVPWVAAPYLGICRVALRRLDRLARTG